MTPLPFLLNADRAIWRDVKVKAQPEDFIVEEVALYEPGGVGDHTYFRVEKRGITTHEAARRLAKALGKRPNDAGIAGLKDAQAVTRQWISFEHVKDEQAAALDLGPEARVVECRRHGNKLRMGHLKGNRFIIRLRLPDATRTAELVSASQRAMDELARRGLPNFYGPQRFGRGGASIDLGRALVAGDETGFGTKLREQGLPQARARDNKFRNLMVNAFQAELFNQVLARRMPRFDELLAGDLAFLHRNGAVFKVEDLEREQPRCAAFEVSPSGPLFGPKMLFPEGEPGAIEREVLSGSGATAEDFGRREAERQPGARRALRVPLLEPPAVSAEADAALITFALPAGSYATVALREIVGDEAVMGLND
jgi:tRNA pseudouridine13 synthase